MSIKKYVDPLNLSLLPVNANLVRTLRECSVRDVFEQNSTSFHVDGLFSTETFGEVGSVERMVKFGYVDIGIKILHPRIYKELLAVSSLYRDVLHGEKYVKYNEKTKKLEESTEEDGDTGYGIIFKHYENLNLDRNDSTKRTFSINFIEKYSVKEATLDKYLVIPAGMREYTITESGKPLEDEINELYRKLITAATTAKQFTSEAQVGTFLNNIRNKVQQAVVTIYEHIENLLDGKYGYIQGKWTKSNILYGTRNVITAIPKDIDDMENVDINQGLISVFGIFQAGKGILPITIFNIRSRFVYDIFDQVSEKALLINPDTLKRKHYKISEKTRSRWITDDGLEDTINKMGNDDFKNSPIVLDGKYLLLIHDDGDTVEVISEIKDDMDASIVRPITYGELLYLSIFNIIHKYPSMITRYPITGMGSVVPTYSRLMSTITSNRRNIKLLGNEEVFTNVEYPIVGNQWFNSLSIPDPYLESLGADFDGDKVSANFLWKEKSIDEAFRQLENVAFFVNITGELQFKSDNYVNNIIMADFTE